MNLTLTFNYHGEHKRELLDLCSKSKNLYNMALFLIKSKLDENNEWILYPKLDRVMKETVDCDGNTPYRMLKSVLAQQCLRLLDSNIKSYIKAIKDWSKHKEKYNGKPNFPLYKKQYYQLIFTNQICSIKDGILKLNCSIRDEFTKQVIKIPIPQYNKYKKLLDNFCCVRIVPKENGSIKIVITYKVKELKPIVNGNKAGIDPGMKNLLTIATSTGKSIIIKGGQINAINNQCNKKVKKLKKELKTNKNRDENGNQLYTSKRIRKAYAKRDRRINALMHIASKQATKIMKDEHVGIAAVGKNKGWKQGPSNLRKKTIQAFQQIPFDSLIQKMTYKCRLAGIEVVETKENYTSLCDALAFESIEKHNTYAGKRTKRGLYQSSIGVLINADTNGAINIMRKVTGDDGIDSGPAGMGSWTNPLLYRNLYKLR